jgi:hypothetical protein
VTVTVIETADEFGSTWVRLTIDTGETLSLDRDDHVGGA